ncbi:MAG TPA: hypothetical protein VN674_03885 [Gemmatimonadales bacterium]|nr:hypothetical protein [Gemmatimonadales bacterium]
MAAAPLGAQQVSAFARHPAATTIAPPDRAATAGPRLNREWHAAPALKRDVMPSSDNHTITLSTIALVLVVVVLVLLIVR